ncbi:MAG: zinc ribbon domain-containing protein [Chloroflexota bacterium]
MPAYEFRCETCGEEFSVFYKTMTAYDAATPACPVCEGTTLSRLITSVNISKPRADHNFRDMSPTQMLSVLESGDSKAVGEMMRQVGDGTSRSALGEDYHNAAEALSRGVSPDKVERDLSAGALGASSDEPLPKPKPTPKPKSDG